MTAEIVACQKRSDLTETFWNKVRKHVSTIRGYMAGIDAPSGTMDSTGLKASISNENPMTRDRISKALIMNEEEESA